MKRLAFTMGAVLLLAGILISLSPGSSPTHSARAAERPSFGPCGADATIGLQNRINSLPSNSSITLGHSACYLINGILNIANTTGITINGNGAILEQDVPIGSGTGPKPILYLTQDTNLKINNLFINGASNNNGSNNGSSYEGGYGLMLEGDTNVTLTGITITRTQGDCMLLQAGNDITPADTNLNVNVRMTLSTLEDCGYHGITAEAVGGIGGFVFSNNKVSNVDLDAMDFEVDDTSTYFVGGVAQGWAENNVQILNNTWTSFGGDWYASLQGQVPGVQSQHVTLSGNTINSQSGPPGFGSAPSEYIDVLGTLPSSTTSPYLNSYLAVTNNTSKYALTKPPDEGTASAIALHNVAVVQVQGNTFPVDSSTYAIINTNNYGLVVKNNHFNGAVGVQSGSSSGNSFVTACGNHYGANGSMVDSTC